MARFFVVKCANMILSISGMDNFQGIGFGKGLEQSGPLLRYRGNMAREFSKAFYKTEAWKDVRDLILKRDRYRCQAAGCYNPAEEVHHIEWLTAENINDISVTLNPDNLVSLCRDCHFGIHKNARVEAMKRQATQKVNSRQSILPEVEFDEEGYPIPTNTPRGEGEKFNPRGPKRVPRAVTH